MKSSRSLTGKNRKESDESGPEGNLEELKVLRGGQAYPGGAPEEGGNISGLLLQHGTIFT